MSLRGFHASVESVEAFSVRGHSGVANAMNAIENSINVPDDERHCLSPPLPYTKKSRPTNIFDLARKIADDHEIE